MNSVSLAPFQQVRSDRAAAVRRWSGRILLAFFAFVYGFLFTLFPVGFVPFLLIPIGILILFTIWALPGARTAPTKYIYPLFLGFYVSLIAWPNYLAIALPGLPWITLIRIFGFPLAIVTMICVSVSSEFRQQVKDVLAAAPRVWKFLIAFVIIQFLSLFFSSKPFESLEKGVIAQIYWTSIFFVSCFVFRMPSRVRNWAILICVLALFVSALGYWEWRIQRVPWAGRIPGFLQIQDENVQRILAGAKRAATGLYRVQSTFTTSLGLAEFLALSMPFFIHFAVISDKLYLRLAALAAIPFIFMTIINTNARLGAVGFFMSFLLYLGIWAVRRWKTVRESVIGPALTLAFPAILIGFFIATLFVGRLGRMVWGGGEHQFSTEARLTQVDNGIPLIFQRPFGYGVGRGADVLGFTNGEGTLTIDSYYLSIGLEYGIPGFIAYFGMFVVATYYGYKAVLKSNDREDGFLVPVVISLVVFMVIKSIFSQESNHPLAFMMLGMVCAMLHSQKERLKRSTALV